VRNSTGSPESRRESERPDPFEGASAAKSHSGHTRSARPRRCARFPSRGDPQQGQGPDGGAGNLLGAEQSGHIGAVGYDLYCRLLRVTVARLRGKPTDELEPGEEAVDLEAAVRAYVPDSYIAEPRLRLEVLHEFDGVVDEPTRAQVEASLRDRFGPPPPEVLALLDLFLLKRLLPRIRIRSVHWQPARYLVVYDDRARLEGALRPAFPDLRHVQPHLCHAMLPRDASSPEAALDRLKGALLRIEEPRRHKPARGPARAQKE
jgi:TRCF domain-containing protein